MTVNEIEELANLLESHSNSCPHLECDGLSQVFHQVLSDKGIGHTVFAGVVTDILEHTTPVHIWIDLDCGLRVDYRLQKWLGVSPGIPHGIFDPGDFTTVRYQGDVIEMPVLPKALIDQMLEPFVIPENWRS